MDIKKFFNNIKGRVSVDLTEEISQHYQNIENFDNVSEENCIKLDNKNKDIYKHNVDLYKNISDKLKKHNAMIKIETPPSPPPQPNNYERYIMHKTRNVSKNVRHQSYAITYLIDKGYKLCINNKDENINTNSYDCKFEPYEAIEIVEKIENMSIENVIKNKDNLFKINQANQTYHSNPPPSAPPYYSTPQSSLYNIPLSTSLPNSIPLTLEKSKSDVNINTIHNSNSMPQLNHSISQTNLTNTHNNYNKHKGTF